MSTARAAGAAAALVAAAAHVPITGEHLHEAPYVGWLFVALEVSCVVLALMLVGGRDRRAWSGAGAVAVGALGAYLLSRTIGLPQIGDDVGDWADPLGIVALTSESLLALLSAAALLGSSRERRSMGAAAGGRGPGRRDRAQRQPARDDSRRDPAAAARTAG